jgi:hypothetical protein
MEARKYIVGEDPSQFSPLVLSPKSPRLVNEPSVKVQNGQMLIAADALAQQLGLTVKADNTARKVTLASKEKEVTLSIKESNGKNKTLSSQESEAVRVKGQLMVPLRYVANAFGAKLKWDEKARIAQILAAEAPDQDPKAKP